jgi:hypothetical protein
MNIWVMQGSWFLVYITFCTDFIRTLVIHVVHSERDGFLVCFTLNNVIRPSVEICCTGKSKKKSTCIIHEILLFIYFLENYYSSFMFLQVTYISIFSCVDCSVWS